MPISLLLLLLAITFTLSTSSAVVDASFSDCKRTFSCGPIDNLTYPFTGADRPAYCGLPELQLKCPNDDTTHPELTINSVTYRVLELNQTLQTLILVNSDLYNNTCPQKLTNSTPNSSIFNPGADNVNLTLFYGCPSPIGPPPPYMFTCDGNGVRGNAFFFIGLIPTNQPLNLIGCDVSLVVPVLKDVGDRLIQNLTSLRQVLTSGFNVNFRDPYSRRCSNCTGSGGQCGVELDNSKFVCFTPDSNSSSNPKTLHIVFPVIGAIFAGIGIGWLIFFCRQRRKRRLAAQNESKDVLTDSTKGLFTASSTNFTQSIPSYPSLKSMVGKGSTYFGAQVFSYTELEQATDNFSPSKELGEGGFGTVYYGTLHDGRVVAVKRLYENNFKRLEQFMNEVEILTRLQHVNLVKLYGCTSKRSRELLLVYEYIPNGTVADHLHGKQASSGFLSWPVRMNIAIETAEALAYLHASDIIHRDVKTNNILLDKNFCVKVADFGLSRLFPNDATHVSTAPQGTPGYVDPEYYRMYKLTDKSDVYSFGVVLIELISSLQAVDTNRHTHDINLANMAINKIQNQSISELVDQNLGYEADASVRKMTIMVAELAFRCLQEDNDMRPSMKEVVDTLRSIQNEKEFDARKVEALEILADDSAPLKGKDCPISPDSVADKWISSNSTSISSG